MHDAIVQPQCPFSIAIIGGGIAGVSLAISCLARNIKVDLYERGAGFDEIGAGIGLGVNAVRAMRICDPGIKKAFDKVSGAPSLTGKETVWFDWIDSYTKSDNFKNGGNLEERHMFTIYKEETADGCHRAHFLDECVKLLPRGMTHFGKSLDTVVEGDSGLVLNFQDGSTATADAVIGCDGIKSRVRELILGEDNPQAKPGYINLYAYRSLIPMDKAIEALGEETAMRKIMHMGQDGYLLTYPVANGKLMNCAAFRRDPNPWPHKRLDVPATPSKVLADYSDWTPAIVKISELLVSDPNLTCWGIFDLGEHPPATFTKGRVCVLGDAAHASSPNLGAGAGMGIEDSAVMAELLNVAQKHVLQGFTTAAKALEAAFSTFDASRRERTQWLVKNSRDASAIYQWRFPETGRDAEKCKTELTRRVRTVWDADIEVTVEEAKEELEKRLLDGGMASMPKL